MKKLVIVPGGFHPPHPGHIALYNAAKRAFPDADLYVAATADTNARPFPFKLKQQLAVLAGIPRDHFVQVKSPFRAEEITSDYDPEDTQLIFVRSDKDRKSQPRPGGIKKDGSPSYLQPYSESQNLPMSQHGYMAYLPTIEFGPGLRSATEIRETWPRLNDQSKLSLVMSLYPAAQKNKKLAQKAVEIFDQVLVPVQENQGWAATLETTLVNHPAGMQIRPEGGMGTWDESSLVRNLAAKFTSIAEMLREKNYTSLYYVLYGSGATRSMVKALADLQAFRDKQGRRPLARGREIEIGEETGVMAGTPAIGGMQATYQSRENQPNIDYAPEQ